MSPSGPAFKTLAAVHQAREHVGVATREELLARIYAIQPLSCPRCQDPMRLIAFLTAPRSIRTILAHLGEPTTPPVPALGSDHANARPRLQLRSDPELTLA